MTRPWPFELLMFAWLTIGFAVVHALISIWGISVVQGLFPEPIRYENLYFTQDGEPIIHVWANNLDHEVLRHLDGTPVADVVGKRQAYVNQIQLTDNGKVSRNSWTERIYAMTDFQRPAVSWYFVVPPNKVNRGYFIGYEQLSRRHVGYIGINGSSMKCPSTEQSFPVDVYKSAWGSFPGTLAGTQLNQQFSGLYEPHANDRYETVYPNAGSDAVWVLSEGTIFEIQLGSQTVRKLIEDRPDYRRLYQNTVERDGKSHFQLLVRTNDGLEFIDPATGKTDSLSLEPVPPESYEQFYELKDGGSLIVHVAPPSRPDWLQTYSMTWLDAEGHVERRTQTRLQAYNGNLFSKPDLSLALCFPLPMAPLGAWAVGPMFDKRMFGDHLLDPGHFVELVFRFPIWFTVGIVTGLATGWACRRRERDVFGRNHWLWPILVGACGWFGWVGYMFLRPLPARLPNRKWVPPSPEPARPLGTEIFA